MQWLVRYSHTQRAHYHSASHECMAVLSGTAMIRSDVADTNADMEKNTHGSAWEDGGIELEAEAGDVFIVPAGVSHKTCNTLLAADFKRLSQEMNIYLISRTLAKYITTYSYPVSICLERNPRGIIGIFWIVENMEATTKQFGVYLFRIKARYLARERGSASYGKKMVSWLVAPNYRQKRS